jgi:hypothetical protein
MAIGWLENSEIFSQMGLVVSLDSGIIGSMMKNKTLNELAVKYAESLVAYSEANMEWNKAGADRSWMFALREARDVMYDLQNQLNDEAVRLAKEMV